MCDTLMLLDGTELHTVGELIEHGILDAARYTEEPRWEGDDPMRECLCILDLEDVLAASGRHWKRGGFGWFEYDAEGRCYMVDGLMEDPSKSVEPSDGKCGVIHLVPNPNYPHHRDQIVIE